MIELKEGNQLVRIDAGELVGYQVDGHECIHQKGSPGWSSADTEMFPIIGPVAEADYLVKTPRGNAILDQHGHMRLLEYQLISSGESSAIYQKIYKAGTAVKNKKYPDKSKVEYLDWPYDFQFDKHFELTSNGLEITFSIDGEMGMPFMLGYHPAFKLHTRNPTIIAGNRQISLDEVLAVGSRALQVADSDSIILKDKKNITISTEGFGHFMCWTEVRNMVCIEPITFYPYAVEQENLHQGFNKVSKTEHFKVVLSIN